MAGNYVADSSGGVYSCRSSGEVSANDAGNYVAVSVGDDGSGAAAVASSVSGD